jgi:5-hydroxyisourate hydrolase-like protein (transthyretin family)
MRANRASLRSQKGARRLGSVGVALGVLAAAWVAGAVLVAPALGVVSSRADTGVITITGTVTNAANAPVAGIWVDLLSSTAVVSAQTDASGTYSITAPVGGPYYVHFQDPQGRYVEQYWNNKPTRQAADPLQSLRAGETTAGINARLARNGSISGKVTSPDGKGVKGITITVYARDGFGGWRWAGSATTSTGGSYTVNDLPPGNYHVGFADPSFKYLSEFYDNAFAQDRGKDVAVYANSDTRPVNAQLELPSSIQGKVTDASGDGVSGITVQVFFKGTDGTWYAVGNAITAGSGAYLVENLPAGTCRVKFADPKAYYLTQYYNGASSLAGAQDVQTAAGKASVNVDSQLVAAARISGTVMRPNGSALLGIKVAVQRKTGAGWKTAGTATSNSQGKYVVGSLAAGTYRVRFTDSTGVFVGQFYKAQLLADKATSIALKVGVRRYAIDARLAVAGRISGVVRGTGDKPLAKAWVTAFRQEGTMWVWAARVSTGPTGAYRITGLAAGDYRVRFYDPKGQYETIFYKAADKFSAAASVHVVAGRTTWKINTTLLVKKSP